ncbi:MAG TPA: hypothetical protein VLK29_04720 [Luteimonas sp.]|nr:hypothetical protein [Luteimonas sp.]
MRSDDQMDIFRDSVAAKAAQWRAAAETCAQQFPGDECRLRYYQEQAERFERGMRGEVA